MVSTLRRVCAVAAALVMGNCRAAGGWQPTITPITPPAGAPGAVLTYKISGKKDAGCELKMGAVSFKGKSAFNGTFAATDELSTNCAAADKDLSVATQSRPGELNTAVPVYAFFYGVGALHISDLVSFEKLTVMETFGNQWPESMKSFPALLSNMLTKGFSTSYGTLAKGTVLYHGTTRQAAEQIWKKGYDVTLSDTELGRAYYTTTERDLAQDYAPPVGGAVLSAPLKSDLCFAHLHDKIKNVVGGEVGQRPVDSMRKLLAWSGKDCVLSRGKVTGPGGMATGTEYAFWTTGQVKALPPPVR